MKNVIATRSLFVALTATLVVGQIACSSRSENRPAARTGAVVVAACKPDALNTDQGAASALITKLQTEGVTVSTSNESQTDSGVTTTTPTVAVSPAEDLSDQQIADLFALSKLAQKISTNYTANCTASTSKYVLSTTEINGWKAMNSSINEVLAKNSTPAASPSPSPASATPDAAATAVTAPKAADDSKAPAATSTEDDKASSDDEKSDS